MKRTCRRRYEWNLLGKQWGINIFRRLDYINGKPMVAVGVINMILWWVNYNLKKDGIDSPEVLEITSSLGWTIINVVMKIAFWVLFADGVFANFMSGFKRGLYDPFLERVVRYGLKKAVEDSRKDIDWAWFMYKHPEIWNRYSDALHEDTVRWMEIGGYDLWSSGRQIAEEISKEFGIMRDSKGRLYALKEKAAKEKAMREKVMKKQAKKEKAIQRKEEKQKAKMDKFYKSKKGRKLLEEL